MENNSRKVRCAVTNFLYHGDEYLLLRRNPNKRIDANRLNGIGGKVEPGENFLDAAIRETEEETGFRISPEHIKLSGVIKLEGGYDEDWIVCFFKTNISSKKIPLGHKTEDGELFWMHKDKVLENSYEVVDDLNYCFKDIVSGDNLFFMTAKVNKNQKIYETTISKLPSNGKNKSVFLKDEKVAIKSIHTK